MEAGDVSLSQDAEAPDGNLDGPQRKEVLFSQQVVGALYISQLSKTSRR